MSQTFRTAAFRMFARAALGVVAVSTGRVNAAIVSWNTDSSGDWMNPVNWSGNAVPGAADDVVINRTNANPAIVYRNNTDTYTVHSLVTNELLDVQNLPLGVSTTAVLNNTLLLTDGGSLKGGTISAGAAGQILVPVAANGRLNGVKLASNLPVNVQSGGELILEGAWQNAGTINTDRSQLYLNGTFSTAGIGRVNSATSSVYIGGVMNNNAATLGLNANSGVWTLFNGTIIGGTIAATDASRFSVASTGTLDAVSLRSDVTVDDGTDFYFRNGLTLNNTVMTVEGGNSTNLIGIGTQTLGGSGTIHINSNSAWMYVAPGGALTIGPGITIDGSGLITPNGQRMVNQGRIVANSPYDSLRVAAGGGFTNTGTIESAAPGSMLLDLGSGWTNTGIVRVSGGQMTLRGAFDQTTLGPFAYSSGTVRANATVNNAGKTFRLDHTTGSWTLVAATVNGGTLAAADGTSWSIEGLPSAGAPTSFAGGVTLDAALDVPSWSTLNVSGGLTLTPNGRITLSSGTMAANVVFTGAQSLTGTGEIVMQAGTKNVLAPSGGSLSIGAGVVVRANLADGTIGAAGETIINNGRVLLQSGGNVLALAGQFRNAGVVEVAAQNNALVRGVGNVTNVGTFVVGRNAGAAFQAGFTNDGTLDLNGAVTIRYAGSPSPLLTLRQQILSGYAFGSWNGIGINSTAAASDPAHRTRIGYAEATDLFSSFPATFRGQSVDATTAIVAYTLAGDANVDGKVDLTDFTDLAANFNGWDRTWSQGDFNYDGAVDLGDFTSLAANFNRTLSASSAAEADVGATVPEFGATLPAAAAAAAAGAARRRRRQPR